MTPRAAQAGLTLIEILVVLALMGVVLQAVLAVQASTMSASVRLSGNAGRLQTLGSLSDYFTGRLRSASDVRLAVSVDGKTCSLSDPVKPCFAVKVSEANPPRNFYMTYQLVPRSEIRPVGAAATDPLAADLAPNDWASTPENQIYVLVEKRWRLAAGAETQPLPTIWDSSDSIFAGTSSSVLADDLAPYDASNAVKPLRLINYDAGTKRFDVFLRLKQQESGKAVYGPADGSFMTSTFYRRN